MDDVVVLGLASFDKRWLEAKERRPKVFGDGRPFAPEAVGADLRAAFEESMRNTMFDADLDGPGILWLVSLMRDLESTSPSTERLAMVAELRKAMLARGAEESERAVSAFALYLVEYWQSTGAFGSFIAAADGLSVQEIEDLGH